MNLLAIDLGTKLGYARRSRGITTSGTVSFAPKVRDGRGRRWANFRAWLGTAALDADLGAVYVEGLIYMPSNQPATVIMFGGFMGHLEHWCEMNNLPLHVVNVSAVKRHWTGKGNAKKADMVAECKRRGLSPIDDNESDALALLDYALCAEGEPTKTPIEQALDAPRVESWVNPFQAFS